MFTDEFRYRPAGGDSIQITDGRADGALRAAQDTITGESSDERRTVDGHESSDWDAPVGDEHLFAAADPVDPTRKFRAQGAHGYIHS